MEKFQSLADFLGVTEKKNGNTRLTDSQEPGIGFVEQSFDALTSLTGKEFAKAVLDSCEFRTYIVAGLTLGTIPPAVLTRLMDHGWGKPIERLEVKDTSLELEELTPEELESRAMRLVEMARSVRLAPMPKGSAGKESIH